MKFLRLLLVPVALLFVAVLRLLRGRVRFGFLMSDRIGHLAGNTEVFLCEREVGIRKGFVIWSAGRAANEYLLSMWGRVLTIDRSGFALIVAKVNRLFDGWRSYEIEGGNLDRDINNLLEKSKPNLHFTELEKARGEYELHKMGLPSGASFVCLIVRDGSYLPQLSYHNYRDSDIDTYNSAILALAERGFYVIRMGAKVDKPLSIKHPKVIDYATNGSRSDFMDIYLGAHCAFCVSSGCGFDAIPYIFRRPICYVNYVPVEYLFTFVPRSLAIWKHHEKDGKRMTFAEIVTSGAGQFMEAQEFENAKIKLVDNTPAEITSLVMEYIETLDHTRTMKEAWREIYSYDDDDQQEAFWKDFPRSSSPYTHAPLHGEIRMRIGREFLKGYQ